MSILIHVQSLSLTPPGTCCLVVCPFPLDATLCPAWRLQLGVGHCRCQSVAALVVPLLSVRVPSARAGSGQMALSTVERADLRLPCAPQVLADVAVRNPDLCNPCPCSCLNPCGCQEALGCFHREGLWYVIGCCCSCWECGSTASYATLEETGCLEFGITLRFPVWGLTGLVIISSLLSLSNQWWHHKNEPLSVPLSILGLKVANPIYSHVLSSLQPCKASIIVSFHKCGSIFQQLMGRLTSHRQKGPDLDSNKTV